MTKNSTEYNLVHAMNLVVNDPAALLYGEPLSSASHDDLLGTIRVLQLYLGKTIEVAQQLQTTNERILRYDESKG